MTDDVPPLFDGTTDGDGWYFWGQLEDNIDVRDYYEAEWRRWYPYCADPEHFLDQVRRDFNARTWEMRVGCAAMDAGHGLARPPREAAPDVLVEDTPRVWIEATAPNPGDGPDAAKRVYSYLKTTDVGSHGLCNIKEDNILLRITGAVITKAEAHRGFVERGVVRPEDRYVVAVNVGNVPDSDDGPDGLPKIVLALFGYGEPVLIVPIDMGDGAEEPHGEWRPQPILHKQNQAKVSTVGFLDGSMPHVSRVSRQWGSTGHDGHHEEEMLRWARRRFRSLGTGGTRNTRKQAYI